MGALYRKKLPNYGPLSQLIDEAVQSQGHSVKYEFYPWARSFSLTEQGSLDGTFVWTKLPEREKVFLYSEPVITLGNYIFSRKDNPVTWEEFDDLKGLSIGGVLSYEYGPINEEEGFNVVRVSEDQLNYHKLASKRIDAVIEDRLVGINRINTLGYNDQITFHPKAIGEPEDNIHYFLVGQANPNAQEIIDVVNAGLAHLKENGRFDEIMGN